MASFLAGFGWAGILSRMLGAGVIGSTLWAGLGGWLTWLMTYSLVMSMFSKAGASSHYRSEDVVGIRGNVTTPIDGMRPGMVSYTMSGTHQTIRAISEDNEQIPSGVEVRIRKIENQMAHVVRVDLPGISDE